MPCIAAVLVPAALVPQPGTRRDPVAAHPPLSGGLHPVSTSAPLEGRDRKQRGMVKSEWMTRMKYCSNTLPMATIAATPKDDRRRGSGGTW
jgi:hypothetical protein